MNNDFLSTERQKKNPFQTPEGYFEGLEDAVFEKIKAQGIQRPATITSVKKAGDKRRWLYPGLMAAASVSLIVAVWLLLRPAPVANYAATQADISAEDLHACLLDNAAELDMDQLAVLYDQAEPVSPPGASFPAPHDSVPGEPSEKSLKTDDIQLLINDLSEEELEEIL